MNKPLWDWNAEECGIKPYFGRMVMYNGSTFYIGPWFVRIRSNTDMSTRILMGKRYVNPV